MVKSFGNPLPERKLEKIPENCNSNPLRPGRRLKEMRAIMSRKPQDIVFLCMALVAPAGGASLPSIQVLGPEAMLESRLEFGSGRISPGRIPAPASMEDAPALPARGGLHRSFERGKAMLRAGRWADAEACFLAVLAADSSDWEARQALVLVYQFLGLRSKRDAELAWMRRMHLAGKAWSSFILRDDFMMAGRHIIALEYPSHEFPGRRKIAFLAADSGSDGARHLASVVRTEKSVSPSSLNRPFATGPLIDGYQLNFTAGDHRRTYFVPYQKPGYSVMKQMLSNFLGRK